jgi:hypothetical protein
MICVIKIYIKLILNRFCKDKLIKIVRFCEIFKLKLKKNMIFNLTDFGEKYLK